LNDDGNNLAKVLWYYNLIPNATTTEQKIVCPFHKDVNPSMTIDLTTGKCFCFGCQKSFRADTFVQEFEKKYNNSDDLKAYRKYFKILKSNKCSNINIVKNKKKCKKFSKELYDEAYDYYHGLRKVNWNEPELSEEFDARDYMIKRGFKPETLIKSRAKITFNKSYMLIFPMLDNGKFKGWVCRTNVKEVEERRKYLYNEGFRRRNTLVGDYGSKDYVFVVEGYMDRLKFIQNGESNVVAILGWKMSDEQINKLKSKGIKYVISALDNDQYGRKGTEYLKKFFNVTRFCYLKGTKDPGEMTEESFLKMHKKTIKRFNQEREEESWD
jgi:DNA primase